VHGRLVPGACSLPRMWGAMPSLPPRTARWIVCRPTAPAPRWPHTTACIFASLQHCDVARLPSLPLPWSPVQFSAALQPAQLERLAALRQSIMSSSPVKLAATKLAELQAIPPSSRDAYMQQLAGSGSGGGGRRGDGGGKGSAMSSPAPTAGGRGGGMASPAVPGAPTARLTAEVAATSLALNNLQLAAACTLRLRSELEGMTTDIFAGAGAAPAPAGSAAAAGGAAGAAAALSDR